MTVYVGSEGLSLNIPFKSLWIGGCLPNNIPFVVGKIDDNANLAVFITEYPQLHSLNNFARNSAPSLILALRGSLSLLDKNSKHQMIYGAYCLHVLGLHDVVSKLITFSDKFC